MWTCVYLQHICWLVGVVCLFDIPRPSPLVPIGLGAPTMWEETSIMESPIPLWQIRKIRMSKYKNEKHKSKYKNAKYKKKLCGKKLMLRSLHLSNSIIAPHLDGERGNLMIESAAKTQQSPRLKNSKCSFIRSINTVGIQFVSLGKDSSSCFTEIGKEWCIEALMPPWRKTKKVFIHLIWKATCRISTNCYVKVIGQPLHFLLYAVCSGFRFLLTPHHG